MPVPVPGRNTARTPPLPVTWTAGYKLSGYGEQEAGPPATSWQPPLPVMTRSESDPGPDAATSSVPPEAVPAVVPAAARGARRLRPGPDGASPAAPPDPLR